MDKQRSRLSRSRSPTREEHQRASRSSKIHRVDTRSHARESSRSLPFHARQLTKHDLDSYRPMFALYLDIQKRLDIDDLNEDEVRGRWKSFLNKWNRGDLAEGWYDPNTLAKARNVHAEALHRHTKDDKRPSAQKREQASTNAQQDEEEEDDYGPALPNSQIMHSASQFDSKVDRTEAGPTIPSHQDLRARDEDEQLSADIAREQYIETIKHERHLERKLQKSQLDEIAPRAEAGTRERQLEKRREVADSNRAFAASKDGGGDVEIRDSDLMGSDDLGDLKRRKKEQERRKTEREIKREEMLRARKAEHGQKLKAMRDKEEKTMSMLREIARERFGDGNEHAATLRED